MLSATLAAMATNAVLAALFLCIWLRGQRRSLRRMERAIRALARERDLSVHLVEVCPLGITVVTPDGKFAYANPQAEQILGLQRARAGGGAYADPGWSLADLAGRSLAPEELPCRRVLQTRTPVREACVAVSWRGGRRALLSLDAVPLLGDGEELAGVVVVLREVTEQQRTLASGAYDPGEE